jgi:RNA polymerase sigma-70 factor (ECF subfamily)
MERASESVIGWVGRQILPHEPHLRAWLRNTFGMIDIDDIVQESYCRLAALSHVDHIDNPRGYFFRTARNVVFEQMRRSRVVEIERISNLAEFDALLDNEDIPLDRRIDDRRMLERVKALIATLPERRRCVFRLRKLEGLSQREIAARLDISETIVENEISRGLRSILRSMTDAERADLPLRTPQSRKNDQRTRLPD